MGGDFWIVVRWWATLFLVGAAAFPLTKRLFRGWYDSGYLFAKAVGMALTTYLVYFAGTLRVFPFSVGSIIGALSALFLLGLYIQYETRRRKSDGAPHQRTTLFLIALEEIFFFAALLFWSWVKAHEPSIRGLEKFMDFGFTQSVLRHPWFPTPDMWYAGATINYYYFGHIVMAMLTKLSGIELAYTFNLMLATLFALCLTMSFSIGYQLSFGSWMVGLGNSHVSRLQKLCALLGGVLTAFLVTLGGNLQALYAFTKGYTGENVQPFWTLLWGIGEFWHRLPEGLNRYWYPNATRFIPFTIHEFPSYSFVVSDIHGHVLGIPFALLAIALLIRLYAFSRENSGLGGIAWYLPAIFYGFLSAVLFMTNALDGPIYLLLFFVLLVTMTFRIHSSKLKRKLLSRIGIVVLLTAVFTSLPFMVSFRSFVTGIAVNCPPQFLANSKIGPVLFEGVEKCQRSPLWMMLVLWGFFLYCGIWLFIRNVRYQKLRINKTWQISDIIHRLSIRFAQKETVLIVFFLVSVALVIFPEFFYFKDIYPAHFRSNTMFKLGYQAFMLFAIVSGYTIVQFLFMFIPTASPNDKTHISQNPWIRRIFIIGLLPLIFLVSVYPIFAVRSYFDSLKTYRGLYGLSWLAREYPDDYKAIEWLNREITAQGGPSSFRTEGFLRTTRTEYPVIVEADGDSYTDYNRMSAFTGTPTVIGWAVHEWLWRGSYNVVSPRREEVRLIYESNAVGEVQRILARYHVGYIIVGSLERQRYVNMREAKFAQFATAVFRSGGTVIYALSSSGAGANQ